MHRKEPLTDPRSLTGRKLSSTGNCGAFPPKDPGIDSERVAPQKDPFIRRIEPKGIPAGVRRRGSARTVRSDFPGPAVARVRRRGQGRDSSQYNEPPLRYVVHGARNSRLLGRGSRWISVGPIPADLSDRSGSRLHGPG